MALTIHHLPKYRRSQFRQYKSTLSARSFATINTSDPRSDHEGRARLRVVSSEKCALLAKRIAVRLATSYLSQQHCSKSTRFSDYANVHVVASPRRPLSNPRSPMTKISESGGRFHTQHTSKPAGLLRYRPKTLILMSSMPVGVCDRWPVASIRQAEDGCEVWDPANADCPLSLCESPVATVVAGRATSPPLGLHLTTAYVRQRR